MGARGKLFLLSVLLVVVNIEVISGQGTQCPENNEGLAVHLPHETNCGLFYHCDWGVAILKECPTNLHFNPVLQVCDWPDRAGCQSGGDNDGNGGDDGDNDDNSDGNGEGDNGGSGDGDNDGSGGGGDSDVNGGSSGGNECPADNEGDAIHLPHDSDCGLFYQCDWGVAILKECPAGLHFNPVLQVCDWPDNAGCQSEGDVNGNDGDDSGNGDGDNGDNSDGNGEDDNGGSGDGNNDSSEDDGDSDVNGGSSEGNECPADNEGDAVHLPHDSDCGLFYQCDWGVAILKECPAGLHFNPVLQVCDWPANAGCQSEGDVDGNGGDDSGNGDGENGDNSDGNGEGDNGGSSDGDNNGSEGNGDSDGNGGSSGGNECPADNEGDAVHLPHDSDCGLFYQCDWGVAILKECPAGLHFNPVLQVCDWPANAGCQSEGDVDGNGGDDSGNGDGDNGDNSDGNGEGDNGGSGDGDNDGSGGGGDNDVNGGSSEGNECPADNEGDAIHLPHDSDCGLFYQCDWGVAILKECPAGLHFNPVLQVCDWPANAGCQSEGDVDGNGGDDSGNGDGENGDNSDGNGEGDNGGSSDGNNNGSEGNGDSDGNGGSSGGNECPADNEGDAVHLPHDSDCGLFYQCDWGVAILKECPAGLHFNPVLQVCDWPDNAGCQSEGDVDGNGGDDSGNGDGDNGDNSDGNGEGDNGGSGDGDNDGSGGGGDSDANGGSSEGNECPADNEGDAIHLPHDSDCGLFYQCDWGVAILKECSAGLHFNPVLQVCDWPANAGCQSEGDVDGNDGDDSGNGDGDNGDNSDGNGEDDNGGSGDGDNDSSEDDGDSDVNGGSSEGNECPADNEGDAVHLPHDSDCGLFYQCDWGVAILKECPAGLHFNPVLQVCDWPANAGCQSEGDVDGNGGDDSGNGDGENGDNSDANGEGDNGGSSDGDNNGSEGNGDSDGNGGSTGGNGCPADNEGDAVHLPHYSDCGLFYQCDWGVATLKECPAGLHFNPVLQVCDWPDNAGCQSEGDVDGNGGDDSGNGDGDNGDNSDGNGEDDNGGSGDGDNDSSEDDGDSDVNGGSSEGNECPAGNEGDAVHFPHDSDCGLFYQCDWGVAILKECPAGLHFNPVLQVCDWPANAGCQSEGDVDGNADDDSGNGDGENGDNSDGNGEGDNGGSSDGDNNGSEGNGDSDGNGGSTGGNECPADNEGDAVHLPHDSDCGLFYQCDWGVAVLKECPAGLHFNPVLQVCDWPNSAGCQSGGGDDGSVGDGDNGDNGDGGNDDDGDDDDNGNSSSEEPSTGGGSGFCNSIRCPEENEEYVTFIPNAEDCTRFCKCNWGLAYEFVCPAGLFFNPVLNVCDYPERAGCNSS